jgi:hypothetical protein
MQTLCWRVAEGLQGVLGTAPVCFEAEITRSSSARRG